MFMWRRILQWLCGLAGRGAREGRGPRLLIGAKRDLRSCDVIPTFYRKLCPL